MKFVVWLLLGTQVPRCLFQSSLILNKPPFYRPYSPPNLLSCIALSLGTIYAQQSFTWKNITELLLICKYFEMPKYSYCHNVCLVVHFNIFNDRHVWLVVRNQRPSQKVSARPTQKLDYSYNTKFWSVLWQYRIIVHMTNCCYFKFRLCIHLNIIKF